MYGKILGILNSSRLQNLSKEFVLLILRKCINCSQFGDIYQEDHFIEYLKDEVNIVKDLPQHLKSTDNKNLSLVCFCILSFSCLV